MLILGVTIKNFHMQQDSTESQLYITFVVIHIS